MKRGADEPAAISRIFREHRPLGKLQSHTLDSKNRVGIYLRQLRIGLRITTYNHSQRLTHFHISEIAEFFTLAKLKTI